MTVTKEFLREHFEYSDGWLFVIKRVSVHSKQWEGFKAGYQKGDRWIVTLFGRKYGLHQLVWIYFNGILPKYGIDHKDRVPMNCRIENLRECTPSTNAQNRIVDGVVHHLKENVYQAKIVIDYRVIYGKRFADRNQAIQERREFERKYHPYSPSNDVPTTAS